MEIPALMSCHSAFKNTLASDVDSLVRLHEKDKATPGRPGEWLVAVRRSAIVLLAANLENYLESLVCDALSHLATSNLVARRYPERFRLWLFREDAHLRSFGIDGARDFITLTLKLYSDVRPLEAGELRLSEIKEQFANPTPTNVNWLFGLLDFDSYVDGVTLKVDKVETSAKAALGELSKRRNDIAHGDASQKPAMADVERLRKFCLLFANRAYKDVTKCVQSSFAKT